MKKIFTLMALACMTLSAQAQGKYALEAGTGTIAAGTQVATVSNITMTFGFAGEKEFNSPVEEGSVEGYTAYTAGNGVNGKADGGTNYIFTPSKDGEITVAVVLNAGKAFFVLENGTALADYNGITVAEKAYTTFKFKVGAGKTYNVYCTSSKLGFYGFEYTVSQNQGDDDNPVVPTNSETYNAIVDGKLAPEFAAVAGDNGGVANNTAEGKSIITIKAGKATVTAVGGTYEVASVGAWNDVSWGLKNQGDIDFWYVTGAGNPYVNMLCMQNSKDGSLVEGSYKADYVYYEPDGSLGLPITGLYYKFTATAQGAFKVKVWANKGNRKTFVVNANTKKAERLLASGYINGVNDQAGKKKLLTVEQVDSVHHIYIWGKYEEALAKGKGDDQTQEDFDAKMAEMKAQCEADEIERQYVIGNGNQNFWGWLTFDVEPGEEYWVFQHSSQIGFGGFEFHEGVTAEDLIQGIEAAYVYTTNFSTYEDENTGERVTWKGEKAVGNGQFATEEPKLDEETQKPINIVPFGDFFRNDGSAANTSYCLLPTDVLAHSANTKGLTLATWVRAQETAANYTNAPIFAAYAQEGSHSAPMFAALFNGSMQLDNGTKFDYNGTIDNDWLADKEWHYYTAVFQGENAKVYIDGVLKTEWNCEGAQASLFNNGEALKYVCLGGNSPSGANDAPFDFARLLIKNSPMSAGEVKAQMTADCPDYEAYYNGGTDGIKAVTNSIRNNAVYNLAGQKVDAGFKGIVIKDGKKLFNK